VPRIEIETEIEAGIEVEDEAGIEVEDEAGIEDEAEAGAEAEIEIEVEVEVEAVHLIDWDGHARKMVVEEALRGRLRHPYTDREDFEHTSLVLLATVAVAGLAPALAIATAESDYSCLAVAAN